MLHEITRSHTKLPALRGVSCDFVEHLSLLLFYNSI